MTILDILTALRPEKPMSLSTLYTHLRALKIKPVGVRQCPARYPDNTLKRLGKRLGLPAKSNRNGRSRRAA
jgi:hypothetical protein